ncbi:SMI1/KNR4 family protein [Rhodopirellula sp. JC639]|uniref:SMI1/KNR4 family protein n=1 Tax=Stieleria mannarensis TaxID=2755585 RepID=UPI0015FEBFDD
MEISTYQLARRCKSGAKRWGQTPSPPLTAAQLKDSRETIDDPLPELLVDLYSTVGNGGFGPHGGLLGLRGGFVGLDSQMTIDGMYHEFMWDVPKEEGWDWPADLLPIAEGGCGLVYCIALDSTDADIHLLDPNGFESGDNLLDYVQSCQCTLHDWLYDWSLTRPPVRKAFNATGQSLLSRLLCFLRGHAK